MHQVCEKETLLMLPKEKQEHYQSGVGMSLCLVKHSWADIANAVQELSKVLDCYTEGIYKEILRCIKYVLDSKKLGLKIWLIDNRSKPWEIVCFTDSDYASDPDTGKYVSGYIMLVSEFCTTVRTTLTYVV